MKEVRACSNQTMKLVSRRLRRAAQILSPLDRLRDRLEVLIHQAEHQGLQPQDFAGAAGDDALIAIAHALPTRARFVQPDHTRTIIVDSFSTEYKTAKAAEIMALYSNKPQPNYPVRVTPEHAFSRSWQRVLDHALACPDRTRDRRNKAV